MLKNRASIGKEKALLARKEQILLDLQYYQSRIRDYTNKTTVQYYSSSDSEDDTSFPPFTLEVGPTLSELKQQEKLLMTCRHATQELSTLAVLQSEVNVLVQAPVIEGERPVPEPGIWREVTAECRIDMVPFSINFYTHQPRRNFAPKSYRGLHVLPVKKAQEAELDKSVLGSLTKPGDAIEVLRSYASAFRSRRDTLARLSDKYANQLSLERLPEGGFMLKCANFLSMSWTLENKRSAAMDFHHKLNFVLEYMDESYLKRIRPEHRKLADPSLQTDERTLILANIITICLEAQTQTQDAYESLESDQESVNRQDKTTLSDDIDETEDINKRKTDEEVMAPPKTIPKKAKPKGRENMVDNRKSVKRASETDLLRGQNAKKAKIDAGRGKSVTDMVKENKISEGDKNKVNKNDKEQINQKGNDDVVEREQINQRGDEVDKEQKKQNVIEEAVDKRQMNHKKMDKQVDKRQTMEKGAEQSAKHNKVVAKNVEKPKNSDNNDKNKNNERVDIRNDKKTEKVQPQSKVIDKSEKQKRNNVEKATDKVKAKSQTTEKNSNKGHDKDVGSKHAKTTTDNEKNQAKNIVEKDVNSKKVAKSDTNTKNVKNDVLKNNVQKESNSKTMAKNQTTKNNDKATEQNKPKSNAYSKTAKTVTQNAKTANNTEKADKENKNHNHTANPKNEKSPTNLLVGGKTSAEKAISTTEKTKTLPKNDPNKIFQSKTVDTENKMANPKNKIAEVKNKMIDPKNKMADPKNKMTDLKNQMADPKNKMTDPKNKMAEAKNKMVAAKNKVKPFIVLPNHRNSAGGMKNNILKASGNKESQIPKKLSPYGQLLQKNAVRVSPRMMSKFTSSSDTNIQTKIFKPSTNIPRLLKQTRPLSK